MSLATHSSTTASWVASVSRRTSVSEDSEASADLSSCSSREPCHPFNRHPAIGSADALTGDASIRESADGVRAADDNATDGSIENRRNEEWLLQLRQFVAQVIALTRDCVFEFGFENEFDCFIRESLAKNAIATREWLNETFLEHFEDVSVVVGILRGIAHLEYEEVYPAGPTMALAALSHSDVEVRECGIRAFENWESQDGLEYLNAIECKEAWLQDYLERVIADLRKRRLDVAASTQD